MRERESGVCKSGYIYYTVINSVTPYERQQLGIFFHFQVEISLWIHNQVALNNLSVSENMERGV